MPNGIIAGVQRFPQRYGTTAVNVLVIGYWNLRFICNLVLGIWDFYDTETFSSIGSGFAFAL
jgi:hypothetical protein